MNFKDVCCNDDASQLTAAMTGKRKRSRGTKHSSSKRQRLAEPPNIEQKHFNHPLLSLYYPAVSTLRSFLLARLPARSRARRKRLGEISGWKGYDRELDSTDLNIASSCTLESEQQLSKLLDTTLVGYDPATGPIASIDISQDFVEFTLRSQRSQQIDATASTIIGEGLVRQTELVHFAIWHLFNRRYSTAPRPPHVLCHGYARAQDMSRNVAAGIHGLDMWLINDQVTTIRRPVWQDVLELLGGEGDGIMLDLIWNCGTFVPVDSGVDNYLQLSGSSLSDLQILSKQDGKYDARPLMIYDPGQKPLTENVPDASRKASSIGFVRNRMFYARPHLNAKGDVRFGLPHIHALNRCSISLKGRRDQFTQTTGAPNDVDANKKAPIKPGIEAIDGTNHLMMYIFPRQFGLHNVFTSTVSRRETTHPFKDYTLREDEIKAGINREQYRIGGREQKRSSNLPRRLRGACFELVRRMQKRHARCSYNELLRHYCPFEILDKKVFEAERKRIRRSQRRSGSNLPSTEMILGKSRDGKGKDLVDAATPTAHVSAFCRAVINQIVPPSLLGNDTEGVANWRNLMQSVDQFVRCRRFERMTLHMVVQKMKVTSMGWLTPPSTNSRQKISKSDLVKRTELLLELLYYIFDSLLIPLLRTNFHITESSSHGNRLFYFRHDVWRAIAEPSLNTIKLNMLQEIPLIEARQKISRRQLAFSHMRFVPKGNTVRPLMNMKRKPMIKKPGGVFLGSSVNDKLRPVASMLNFEKSKNMSSLGASLFSVGDLYPKLRIYLSKIDSAQAQKLYFVKVDVTKCFDTIPQERIVQLMKNFCSEEDYSINRHAELKHSSNHGCQGSATVVPSKKFPALARSGDSVDSFRETVELLAPTKRGTFFIDFVTQMSYDANKLLRTLEEHLKDNWVKLGKRYYRQKQGIPQGSSVSSLLCNLFYADFERGHLDFLDGEAHLLMRLTDDFLLITPSKSQAVRFLQVMHQGNEEYGITVKPEKTLTNFPCKMNGIDVKRVNDKEAFPYCGIAINTRTLEISKDMGRRLESSMSSRLCDCWKLTHGSTERFSDGGTLQNTRPGLLSENDQVS